MNKFLEQAYVGACILTEVPDLKGEKSNLAMVVSGACEVIRNDLDQISVGDLGDIVELSPERIRYVRYACYRLASAYHDYSQNEGKRPSSRAGSQLFRMICDMISWAEDKPIEWEVDGHWSDFEDGVAQ